MFEPVPMTRLNLVVLERDERAVLGHLGRAGVVQLTRTAAGAETAPLSPRNRSAELARLEQLASRLENVRHALELPPFGAGVEPAETTLDLAEKSLGEMEQQAAGLAARRQSLQQQLAVTLAADDQVADYCGFDLPLDHPAESAFLHFVTGSLPAKNLAALELKGGMTLVPLVERNGRQRVIALAARPDRFELDRVLQAAGFQPEQLPEAVGATADTWRDQNQCDQKQAAAELEQVGAKLAALAERFLPACAQADAVLKTERSLLEAGQNFPRTESAICITGWVPRSDCPTLSERIREITGGHCCLESVPAAAGDGEEAPVLLRHPWWLRPFSLLVTAYGLPRYCELEPTLLVAASYLLMFGMMFGDVGHGLVLALGGLALLLKGRGQWRDAGVLVLSGGCSSMVFGALYGSCFGLPQFRRFALWQDPLAGDPMRLMYAAIVIGIVMISLGLVLNIVNRFRQGDYIGGWLDKFGVAGAVFYWGTLTLATQSAAFRSRGLWLPAILFFMVAPVVGWILRAPIQLRHERRANKAAERPGGEEMAGGIFATAMESFVEAFEALLSYFANTISFVRLAAYAMSHAALLMAAFMIAGDLKHLPVGAGPLSVLAVVLGNVVAILLECIVASVQALRLEYYEFFGKFFSGAGKPFQPFCLAAAKPG